MAGFSIDILSNVKDVQRGATDVEKSFSEVADSLDDLAKAADKAGDKLGDSIGDGAKDASRRVEALGKDGAKATEKIEDGAFDAKAATEKLERSFKDAADAAKREMSSAGDSVKREVNRGTDGAREGLKDFKEESASTAKESAASFSGSASDIADAFQEVAANAFIGFAAPGIVAGLALAGTIGVISTAIQDGAADTEAFKQKVADLTTELIEAGDKGGPSLQYLVDQLKALATETDDGATSLADLRKVAEDSGNSFEDLAQAYSGSLDELQKLNKSGKERLKQLEDEAEAIDTTTDAGVQRYSQIEKQIAAQDQLNGYVSEATKRAEEAAQAEQNFADAGGRAMEARANAMESVQSSVDDAVGAYEEFHNAETGAIDPAAYIQSINDRIAANGSFTTNIQTLMTDFGLSYEAAQAIFDQGIDMAPTLQSVADSGLQQQFADTMNASVQAGQSVINGTEFATSVDVTADTKPATTDIFKVQNEKRDTTITAKADTKAAESQIKQVASAPYSASIYTDADVSAAQARVDAFFRRNDGRTLTVTQVVKDRNGNPVS